MTIDKKIKNALIFIINLFKLHYDGYVAYRWRDYSILGILKLENLKFVRRVRIAYWQKRAINYQPFSFFFRKDKLMNIQQNNALPLQVRDIYKTGYAVISNVLPDDDVKLMNDFAHSQTLKSDCNFIQVELPTSFNNVRAQLIKKLEPVLYHFFPKPMKEKKFSKIYVGMRIDYSFNGIDSSPQTANWHVDRFIPTINAIYFPSGCNWGEFEKDIGDPLITSDDVNFYINDPKKEKKIPEAIRENYYFKFKDRKKKKFTLQKNTMYLGTHHMQHRRSPISTPGKRIAIFIDFYDFFTRKYL